MQLALIQHLLPEALLQHVLSFLSPYELGRVALVCQSWNSASRLDSLWRAGCGQAFQTLGRDEVLKLARLQYKCASALPPAIAGRL